ncbi:pseudouridine synthase PUS4 [Sporobolomyces koalae]|uniref:pseudouridine synthase PUS4 n=1 Tax=Sporobolomyces koalae TaxID=500713 RepID=UPI003173CFAD
MPKAANTPLSCLFAINKPTGQPSMTLLNKLQPLFSSSSLFKEQDKQHDDQGKGNKKGGRRSKWKQERVKMGQGGTLDPLADGVLVVGTNAATKQLSQFLDCTKSYRAIALVGCSTDSYDSDGKIVKQTGWSGVTAKSVQDKLDLFRGEIEQIPPVYSALKMDGKPLYEYARSNLPLPRPIPSRKVTISEISLLSFTAGDERTDQYEYPKEVLGDEERLEIERLEKMVKEGKTVVPSADEVIKKETPSEGEVVKEETASSNEDTVKTEGSSRPPIFEISLTVSSGTYIRSVVHDLGIALGSSAHIVKLTRTRQGQFTLSPPELPTTAPEAHEEVKHEAGTPKKPEDNAVLTGCVEWTMLEKAIERQDKVKKGSQEARDQVDQERAQDPDGYLVWEKEILRLCKSV